MSHTITRSLPKSPSTSSEMHDLLFKYDLEVQQHAYNIFKYTYVSFCILPFNCLLNKCIVKRHKCIKRFKDFFFRAKQTRLHRLRQRMCSIAPSAFASNCTEARNLSQRLGVTFSQLNSSFFVFQHLLLVEQLHTSL